MKKTFHLQTTDSTNLVAKKLAEEGCPAGTAVIAEAQLQGRGRLGKSWSSPAGKGLYCSIVLRPALALTDFPQLTFVAGLSVARAIENLYTVQIDLKWPNDIYLNGLKCGGILTESSCLNSAEGERYAIVGIGLNVNSTLTDLPHDIQQTATSLVIQTHELRSIEELFDEIREELDREVLKFEKEGFFQVIQRWRKRDFLKGKMLNWLSVKKEPVLGISLGADDSGRLHVQDIEGVVHEILSGDIRLANTG